MPEHYCGRAANNWLADVYIAFSQTSLFFFPVEEKRKKKILAVLIFALQALDRTSYIC